MYLYKLEFNFSLQAQFLISTDGYSIRNTASNIRDFKKKNRYLKLIEIHQETFNKNVNKLTIKDKKMINLFYDGIRNHMNHAATIDQTKFNFNEIYCYKLAKDYEESKKYFYIKDNNTGR